MDGSDPGAGSRAESELLDDGSSETSDETEPVELSDSKVSGGSDKPG